MTRAPLRHAVRELRSAGFEIDRIRQGGRHTEVHFLDANGVDYQSGPVTRELKPADIGERAKKFTLFIECLR